MPDSAPRTPVVVLTGGPCGGKTTCLGQLSERLRGEGWRPLVLPELATSLYSNGVRPTPIASPKNQAFRQALVRAQLARERMMSELAELDDSPRTLILQDRGVPDEGPYFGSLPDFERALRQLGTSLAQTLDRYFCVAHLSSVAVDLPRAYSLANNTARQEEVEAAAEVDQETWNLWRAHPRARRFGNLNGDGNAIEARVKYRQVYEFVVESLGASP